MEGRNKISKTFLPIVDRALLSLAFWPVIGGMMILGVFLHGLMLLNPDTSVHVMQAQRILRTGELNPMLYDANLPLIWWLNVPGVVLADLLNIAQPAATKAWGVLVLTMAYLVAVMVVKKGWEEREDRRGMLLMVTMLYWWLPLTSGNNYLQKEVVHVWLMLPYLLLGICRLQLLHSAVRPAYPVALLGCAGALAAAAAAVKPVYFPSMMVFELFLYWQLRRDYFRRVELWVALAVGSALSIVLINVIRWEDYWQVLRLYQGFATRERFIMDFLIFFLNHSGLLLLFMIILRPKKLSLVCLLAGAAALLAVLYQQRLFIYHWHPYTMWLMLACATMLFSSSGRQQRWECESKDFFQTGLVLFAIFVIPLTSISAIYHREEKTMENMQVMTRQLHGEAFYNFGSCLLALFPYAHYHGLKMDDIIHSDWHVSQMAQLPAAPGNPMEDFRRRSYAAISKDLAKKLPKYLILEQSDAQLREGVIANVTGFSPELEQLIHQHYYYYQGVSEQQACDNTARSRLYQRKAER